jgi:hypothetical protein
MKHISNRLTCLFLLSLSVKLLLVSCIVLPEPTKTSYLSQTASVVSYGTPTTPTLAKRGEPEEEEIEEDNLDLYQNWASACRNRDNNNALIVTDQPTPTETADPDNLSINNLWKTVTQTVNCGGGQAVTVTKTVNARPTSTPSSEKKKKKACVGRCWSDYLWRKYIIIERKKENTIN